jgi:hypothetical protein
MSYFEARALALEGTSTLGTETRAEGAELVPSDWAQRALIVEFASLRDRHLGAFDEAPLVLPNNTFFPDRIAADEAGIRALFQRMLRYSPLPEDVAYDFLFVDPSQEESSSCSSGACGPAQGSVLAALAETADTYLVPLDVRIARDPVRLSVSLARSLGAMVLSFADEKPKDGAFSSEVAASLSGFGVILANGACHYVKSCGGARVLSGTTLSVEEHAYLLALFIQVGDASASAASKHLSATAKECFERAMKAISRDKQLVRTLQDAPNELASGSFGKLLLGA